MLKDFLISFRKRNNLIQKEMANKMGISQTYYCQYEAGIITKSTLKHLKQFKNSFNDVLTDSEIKELDEIVLDVNNWINNRKINKKNTKSDNKENNGQEFRKFLLVFRSNHMLERKDVANKLDMKYYEYRYWESGMIKHLNLDIIKKFYTTYKDILTKEELEVIDLFIKSIKDNESIKIDFNNLKVNNYKEDDKLADFLVKFKYSHMLSRKQVYEKLGITQSCYYRYDHGKLCSVYFVNRFLKVFDDILTDEERKFLNSLIKKEYIEDEPFIDFLSKFKFNHNLTRSEIYRKLKLYCKDCDLYGENSDKYITLSLIKNFKNAFMDILTDEEKEIVEKYFVKTMQKHQIPYQSFTKDEIDNLYININAIIKNVRSRNKISLRKMGNDLGVSSTYINNTELGKWQFSSKYILAFYNFYESMLTDEEKQMLITCLMTKNADLFEQEILKKQSHNK